MIMYIIAILTVACITQLCIIISYAGEIKIERAFKDEYKRAYEEVREHMNGLQILLVNSVVEKHKEGELKLNQD